MACTWASTNAGVTTSPSCRPGRRPAATRPGVAGAQLGRAGGGGGIEDPRADQHGVDPISMAPSGSAPTAPGRSRTGGPGSRQDSRNSSRRRSRSSRNAGRGPRTRPRSPCPCWGRVRCRGHFALLRRRGGSRRFDQSAPRQAGHSGNVRSRPGVPTSGRVTAIAQRISTLGRPSGCADGSANHGQVSTPSLRCCRAPRAPRAPRRRAHPAPSPPLPRGRRPAGRRGGAGRQRRLRGGSGRLRAGHPRRGRRLVPPLPARLHPRHPPGAGGDRPGLLGRRHRRHRPPPASTARPRRPRSSPTSPAATA